jgi:hypothetical protein
MDDFIGMVLGVAILVGIIALPISYFSRIGLLYSSTEDAAGVGVCHNWIAASTTEQWVYKDGYRQRYVHLV